MSVINVVAIISKESTGINMRGYGNCNAEKVKTRGIAKRLICIMPALFLLAVIWFTSTGPVYANWHDIDLKPGQTYDCADASANTTISITKPGDYYLKGKSSYVRVEVNSGGVNLYLEDGLELNCGALTYIGSRTSPINIGEMGGTVKIISRKNAKIYLEGYMAPGIRKDETTTALVFETEDPSNPGSIEAIGGMYSAGIGSVMHVSSTLNPPCGNITFNSGKIKAKGADSSAGIGGGFNTALNGITINGGEITATGSQDGAGIGAGYYAKAENIFITGGTVNAETDHYRFGAAAIGGGGGASGGGAGMTGSNIFISGGTVNATSYGNAPAIGGGKDSAGKNIVISGGNVHAELKASENYKGAGSSAAIGGGGGNVADSDVKISGGIVYAKGGYSYPGIGSRGTNLYAAKVRVSISGGTVTSVQGSSGSYDIGSGPYSDDVDIRITGGSVYASNVQDPKNDKGDFVHRVDVSFDGYSKDGVRVSDAEFSDGMAYGMNDVYTSQGGKIFPWLANTGTNQLRRAKLGDTMYGGAIPVSATSGTLYKSASIKLHPDIGEPGFANGSASVCMYDTKLSDITKPTAPEGFKLGEYVVFFNNAEHQIAKSDGTLYPNVEGYTDENARWISSKGSETFYAQVDSISYSMHFDPNQPKGTAMTVSGSMGDVSVGYSNRTYTALPQNGFDLPGYYFHSWNTKADGSGTKYDNKASVPHNMTTKDGDVVTLYAQWKPRSYNIHLKSGDSHQGTEDKEMSYDQHDVLPKISEFGWSYDMHYFHCWKDENGNMYDDGDDVVNVIKTKDDGTPQFDANGFLIGRSLTAQWVATGKIAVTVTLDGQPEAGHKNHFKLIKKDDPNTYFEREFTYADGVYTFESPDDETDDDYIPFGTYILSFDPEDNEHAVSMKEIDYQPLKPASAVFDYYTVSIVKDPSVSEKLDVAISGDGGFVVPGKDDTMYAPDGANLTIHTKTGPGYHFDGYSVLGITPGNKDDDAEYDPSAPTQTITVRGGAEIMAHAEANTYKIVFDKNDGKIVTGNMADQDMVYDQPQNLFTNGFECIGGSFTAWNTEADGSGSSYGDGERVQDLTDENSETITLYAQWDMEVYDITYDLDGGAVTGGRDNPDKYTAADPDIMLIAPEKEDYDFIGWIGTNCPVPTKEVVIEGGSTGAREYTACWRMKSFLVTFELNGGAGETEERVLIHHKATKPEGPNRRHYTFGGWYVDESLTTRFDFETAIEKDTTIYAKWNSIPRRITYDLNGGTLDGQTGKIIVEANEGDVIKVMKAPSRDGYEFKYWKGSKYYPGDSYTVEEDHTLTAIWKKDKGSSNGNESGSGGGHGVDTGDDSILPFWILLMGGSVAILLGMILHKLRRRME